MNRLAILGLGLMGGSLGMAAKQRRVAGEVRGYARREVTREAALERGLVDAVFDDPVAVVEGADLAVLCVPVLATPALAAACAPGLAPGSIVTDVGSTKDWLAAQMREVLAVSAATFVGSHPIAGSDRVSLDNARADLYDGAVVVVTPEGSDPPAVEQVVRFWSDIGACPQLMGAAEHDAVIARTSHLPHVLASVLAHGVLDGAEERVRDLCGTGFADTTRIAGGSEVVWHDIIKSNPAAICAELERFGRSLEGIRKLIAEERFEEVQRWLAEVRDLRCAHGRGAP